MSSSAWSRGPARSSREATEVACRHLTSAGAALVGVGAATPLGRSCDRVPAAGRLATAQMGQSGSDSSASEGGRGLSNAEAHDAVVQCSVSGALRDVTRVDRWAFVRQGGSSRGGGNAARNHSSGGAAARGSRLAAREASCTRSRRTDLARRPAPRQASIGEAWEAHGVAPPPVKLLPRCLRAQRQSPRLAPRWQTD